MSAVRLRPAARALVLDEDDNVLLVHFDWPGVPIDGGFWACPGGGIDPGETPADAVRRELLEELGLEDAPVGGALWRLSRVFPMQGWDGQSETWYLVRTLHFTPAPRVDLVAENVHGIRWFSPEEVAAGVVAFSPRDLHEQLTRYRTQGVPAEPYDIPALP